MNDATISNKGSARAVILCVDDEPNILNSLQRLLHRHGYQVLTADSGAAGLSLLQQHSIDLVISDMRMPKMDGSEFLTHVRQHWPETIRILLTGYADIDSTMAAINQGEIYRYIAKPWDDNEVALIVQHAIERRKLQQDKQRLEVLTQQQNEELKQLNANLEIKVQERTMALRQVLQDLQKSNNELSNNFLTSVSIFSNLMELRAGGIGGHARRVAELAHKLALQLQLSPEATQDVVLAALLHDIGKIGLADDLLNKPVSSLTPEEMSEVRRHPQIAQAALMPLEKLRNAANLIRSHHEQVDGHGYPDGLTGSNIPLGSRILQVANDFDSAQHGRLLAKQLTPAQAYDYIVEASGQQYDAGVVEAFKQIAGAIAATPEITTSLCSSELKSGMVLAKDLIAPDGLLLLHRDQVLTEGLIAQMIQLEHTKEYRLNYWIKTQG